MFSPLPCFHAQGIVGAAKPATATKHATGGLSKEAGGVSRNPEKPVFLRQQKMCPKNNY